MLIWAALAAAAAAFLLMPGAGMGTLRGGGVVGVEAGRRSGGARWIRTRLLAVAMDIGRRISVALPGSRRRRAAEHDRVIEALGALVSEVRAGQPIRRAWERALTSVSPGSTHVASRSLAASRWGGDVVAALRQDARDMQEPLLEGLAACWSVSEGTGAGLASSVERLVEGARAAADVRVQLEAHLAAPRATARLLATLPLLGLLLGVSLGGDPLSWLLGTAMGRACVVAGVALTLLGLWWTGRIADRAERLL